MAAIGTILGTARRDEIHRVSPFVSSRKHRSSGTTPARNCSNASDASSARWTSSTINNAGAAAVPERGAQRPRRTSKGARPTPSRTVAWRHRGAAVPAATANTAPPPSPDNAPSRRCSPRPPRRAPRPASSCRFPHRRAAANPGPGRTGRCRGGRPARQLPTPSDQSLDHAQILGHSAPRRAWPGRIRHDTARNMERTGKPRGAPAARTEMRGQMAPAR